MVSSTSDNVVNGTITKTVHVIAKFNRYNVNAIISIEHQVTLHFYQIQLTTANHDPTVFGGMVESNQYSHEFDPTRNRLKETMTF